MEIMESNIKMIGRDAKMAMIVRESRIFRKINSIKASKTAMEFRGKHEKMDNCCIKDIYI